LRFKPAPLSESPFNRSVEDYLSIKGVVPKPWATTYGSQFEKIYVAATRTHGQVDFTLDQINAYRAISRVVLDYIVALAAWVDRRGDEPELKPVGKSLASYLIQAREHEMKYDFAGRSLADFVRYHTSTLFFQVEQLQRMADRARKLTSETKRCVVKFTVSMEMELPVEVDKARQHLDEHGCKLYFSTGKPSRVKRFSMTEALEAPDKTPPKPKAVPRKRKKKRRKP